MRRIRRSLIVILLLALTARVAHADEPKNLIVPPADDPWHAMLSSGVGVELVGLAENPSDDRPWWRPDGTTLAQRPYDPAASDNYRISLHDFVVVSVTDHAPNDPTTSQVGYVSASGMIRVPGIGPIKAEDVTVADLKEAILSAYDNANIHPNSEVRVDVTELHGAQPNGRVSISADEHEVAREMAIRLSHLPSDKVSIKVQIDPMPYMSICDMYGSEQDRTLLRAMALAVPADQKTLTLRVGIAAGKWQTIMEGDYATAPPPSPTSVGGVGANTFITIGPTTFNDEMSIGVYHDMLDKDMRIEVCDSTGHTYIGRQLDFSTRTMGIHFAIFTDVKAKDVRQIIIQARTFDWVEFKNVSLSPQTK